MKLRKKTKRRRRGLLSIGIVVLTAACLVVLFLLLFQVRKIEVSGNKYMSEAEVADWIQSDQYATNTFYIWMKYKFIGVEAHPSLEKVEVKLKNPWTVSVQVYEKNMVGFIYYENDFIYFDREGKVLARDMEFRDGVPMIEGLSVNGAELYEVLQVEDQTIFDAILEAARVLEECGVYAERIVCIDSELYLYFDSVCARVGNVNLENRIIQIPPILEKLEGKRGLLHLENYQNADSMISFEENVWPDERQNADNSNEEPKEDENQENQEETQSDQNE